MRMTLARIFGRHQSRDSVADGAQGQSVATMLRGQRGRIVATTGAQEEREHLRSLGLEPGVEVQVCRAGSTCVLGVGFACGSECRIGVERGTARRILVDCTLERAATTDETAASERA